MAEENTFTPIETQEAFDAAIKERIERAKASVRDEFKDYEDFKTKASAYDEKVKEYEAKITALTGSASEKDSRISELQAKVATYESDSVKTRLAAEYGLDPETIEFMTGKDEKEWRQKAEKISALTKKPYPHRSTKENASAPSLAKSLQSMLKGD